MRPTGQPRPAADDRLEKLFRAIDPSWAEVTRDILYHRGQKALHTAPAFEYEQESSEAGLLEHLIETAELSLTMADLESYRSKADRDLLVAMALTHDVGKIDSYSAPESQFGYGRANREMNSAGAGLLILGEARAAHKARWQELKRYDDIEKLAHSIAVQDASLGGKTDHASHTLESVIVYHADRAITGMRSFVSGGTLGRESGADRHVTLLEFWKHLESRVTGYQDWADQGLKFYVGAISALSVWLATARRTGPVFSLFPLMLGVAGAGHLAFLYLRAWRLRQQARHLADEVRVVAGLSDDEWPYSAAFKPKSIFSYGHPITEPAFSLTIVLALSGIYTYVLLSLP